MDGEELGAGYAADDVFADYCSPSLGVCDSLLEVFHQIGLDRGWELEEEGCGGCRDLQRGTFERTE